MEKQKSGWWIPVFVLALVGLLIAIEAPVWIALGVVIMLCLVGVTGVVLINHFWSADEPR